MTVSVDQLMAQYLTNEKVHAVQQLIKPQGKGKSAGFNLDGQIFYYAYVMAMVSGMHAAEGTKQAIVGLLQTTVNMIAQCNKQLDDLAAKAEALSGQKGLDPQEFLARLLAIQVPDDQLSTNLGVEQAKQQSYAQTGWNMPAQEEAAAANVASLFTDFYRHMTLGVRG